MAEDIRWIQRFENFDRAVARLAEPVSRGLEDLSELEQEGTVQRFEYVLELAWKTLKDYLQHQGTTIEPVTPRSVIEEAFAAKILRDGHVWIDMFDHRNLLSHTYDASTFERAVTEIIQRYYPAIAEVHAWLRERIQE